MSHWKLILCVSLVTLFLPVTGKVSALDFTVFPLISLEWEEDQSQTSILWPIFEREIRPGFSSTALRPLWHGTRDDNEGVHRWNALWPILWWKHDRIGAENERRQLMLLPLLSWKHQADPHMAPWRFTLFPFIYTGRSSNERGDSYFILFPFVWMGSNSRVVFPIYWSNEESFEAVFPLWGRFDDLWARDEISFFLWPLWSSASRWGQRSHNIVWPFLGWAHEEGSLRGLRAWPFIGYRDDDEGNRTGFYLWPFGHFRRGTLSDGGPNNLFFLFPFRAWWEIGNTRMNSWWPLRSLYETSTQRTVAWAWPLYINREDRQEQWEENRLLWFIYRHQRGEEHNAHELFPLLGYREQPGNRLSYLLWPMVSHRESWTQTVEKDSRLFLPFYVRSETRRLNDESWRRWTWVFPLTLQRKASDGSSISHWIFPFFVTRDSTYERSWGGLFGLYEKGTRTDGSSWTRLLGPLYRRDTEADGTVDRRYRGLIFQHDREGENRRTAILWGLISRRSGVDGSDWDLFDFGGEITQQ